MGRSCGYAWVSGIDGRRDGNSAESRDLDRRRLGCGKRRRSARYRSRANPRRRHRRAGSSIREGHRTRAGGIEEESAAQNAAAAVPDKDEEEALIFLETVESARIHEGQSRDFWNSISSTG